MRILKISFLFLFLVHGSLALADVNHYFNQIKKDPRALFVFLKAMPKGGELHYHLAGSAYPEVLLLYAAQGHYCLNQKTLAMTEYLSRCEEGVQAHELRRHPRLYEQTIRSWSMANFTFPKESGHDHFFASFGKFMPVVWAFEAKLLADAIQRAVNQNEFYLEVMVQPDRGRSARFARNKKISMTQLPVVRQELLSNTAFQANINETINGASLLLKKAHQNLNCDKQPSQVVCKIPVKFQYLVLREQPLENLFAQALNGFAAASRSPDLVGINLVQAEDGPISLRDYRQQMQIFSFLHHVYPKVHIALHAGELDPLTVKSADLRFHIRKAIEIGSAERIGHGTDIAFENDAESLFHLMAKKPVAVEINLTSNRFILNCFNKKHPLRNYLKHHVPVVLSTDDEGVLRTDLTHQYMDAVLNHHIDYPTLKMMSRNALTYSFLPGASLWADAAKAVPVNVCRSFHSFACLRFLKQSEKARLQWLLEKKMKIFESRL